jgi:hypothetical protein
MPQPQRPLLKSFENLPMSGNPIYARFFKNAPVVSGKEGRSYRDRVFRKQLVAANIIAQTTPSAIPLVTTNAASGPALQQHLTTLSFDIANESSGAYHKKTAQVFTVGKITNNFIKFLF